MRIELADIRHCFEGAIPAVLASANAQGEPNVILVSQVDYLDASHVALSFQFFNKTRRNILENPDVQLMLVHPYTGLQYRLAARYLRTEFEGPLFERMKAKLAGIASHAGMSGVFKLLGSDVYEVQDIERIACPSIGAIEAFGNWLPGLRRSAERVSQAESLAELFDALLQSLAQDFRVAHAMLLLPDGPGRRLYTVGSLGYAQSGVGSEVGMGEGVIGVAAQSRTPVRINHFTQDAAYCRTVREGLGEPGAGALEREIAVPGLAAPHSQLALPIQSEGRLLGVLFLESPHQMAFDGDLEDALAVLCTVAGGRLCALQRESEATEDAAAAAPAAPVPQPQRPALRVRYFEADGSVFLDSDYLIKGVAGAILWTLLSEAQASGRTEFTNRELRLSPSLRLPDVNDNLEARLVLLQRRLAERQCDVRIEKTGRGRFRVLRERPVELTHVPR
ncbi:GAF domain-containing protein [Ramlibacter rhizophilus]|uniref:GAF domain-containing protein n=1 Tax=Ramlibacter rhizophilus TaxID=1781167 RepID=A0A4Z0C3Q1_9BURK|nr:GAF domain-containing protein [Ramlibacter rhizophilus]TFZ05098.1 GAF domain-containing protein [Ramlibacter rhizophilus]